MTTLIRYDIVGSFLRPEALKEARHKYEVGEITAEALKKIEDEHIIELIKKQEENGLKAVTDGEFRRSWWHLDFFWGLNGVDKVNDLGGYQFNDQYTRSETAQVTGKISGENHPFVEHYKFVRDHTSQGIEARQTIPAPAQLLAELFRPENIKATEEHYPNIDSLVDDIVAAYQKVILDLYDAGLRTLQLDDCTWGALVGNQPGVAVKDADGFEDVEQVKALYLKINNAVIAGLPEDLTVNTHVCRGNYNSSWASQGGYEAVASPLFDQENVQTYYLEYDTDRAGGFEPLKHVSSGKNVVLGLISSKVGELEDKDEVIRRIHEAAEYVPLDRLALSTQCGFASTEEGNVLTEEEQWEKVRFVKEIAEEVWDS